MYTGEDIIAETGARVNLEMKLGFGKCKLAVQVPKAHKDAPIGQYAGARVVTVTTQSPLMGPLVGDSTPTPKER